MPDRDGIYDKYRVFYAPPTDDPSTAVTGYYDAGYDPEVGERWDALEEVPGTFFVLRPDHDHHARVAMAAYAESVAEEYPGLSDELYMIARSHR